MKGLRLTLAIVLAMGLVTCPALGQEIVCGPAFFNHLKAYFYNFYSVSPLPSGEVWTVGSHGIICKLDLKLKKWIVQESGTDATLFNVAFVDSKRGWLVGQNGLIMHTDDGGDKWLPQSSGTSEHLFCLSFKSAEKGWAVGAMGTLLHTSDGGKTWKPQRPSEDKIFNYVYFVDERHGWVVGEFSTILATSDGGLTWVAQKCPLADQTLFSVYFEDPEQGWITGMDGAVLRTHDGGKTWREEDRAESEHLFSVQARGEHIWAVGLKGGLAVCEKGTWTNAASRIPTRAWLKQCAFVSDKIGWVVGSVGTLLYTSDAGQTWFAPWNVDGCIVFPEANN